MGRTENSMESVLEIEKTASTANKKAKGSKIEKGQTADSQVAEEQLTMERAGSAALETEKPRRPSLIMAQVHTDAGTSNFGVTTEAMDAFARAKSIKKTRTKNSPESVPRTENSMESVLEMEKTASTA